MIFHCLSPEQKKKQKTIEKKNNFLDIIIEIKLKVNYEQGTIWSGASEYKLKKLRLIENKAIKPFMFCHI